MRTRILLAAALTVPAVATAHADGWCGYTTRDKAVIECGYTTATQCESAVGKGGICFVDPDYALNAKRATPAAPIKANGGHA